MERLKICSPLLTLEVRLRIGSTVRRTAVSETIRTYGDYLALLRRGWYSTRASNRNFIFSRES